MPPIIIGLPTFSTSGAIACTCVERIEPMKATVDASEARRLKASTAPGLVVWSSATLISSLRPITPPFALTASSASLMPLRMNCPDCAAAPVSGEVTPIRIVSAARATIAGAASAAAPPISAPRLVMSVMVSSSSLVPPLRADDVSPPHNDESTCHPQAAVRAVWNLPRSFAGRT